MNYRPNNWVLVKITSSSTNEELVKVFAGWHGSLVSPGSWKLSSDIIKAAEFEDRYEFVNSSGSTYICYKDCGYMSHYMRTQFNQWQGYLDYVIDLIEIDQAKQNERIQWTSQH